MMSSTPPLSATPPADIVPARILAFKAPSTDNMAAIFVNHAISTSGIGPTKKWVVPPRPKPGRKPLTDTPPTKRKAQNRAAQRAFRERRAARVGELEEQLKETEEERHRRESSMHSQIALQSAKILKLEEDVKKFSEEAISWQHRHFELQRRLEDESVEKNAAVMELAYLRNGSRAIGTNAVPLPPRREQHIQRITAASVVNNANPPSLAGGSVGCGNCTSTSRCACLEIAMTIMTSGCDKCTVDSHCACLDKTLKDEQAAVESDLKRHSSTAPLFDENKRIRFSIENPTEQEIDFTPQFAQSVPTSIRPELPIEHLVRPSNRVPAESCGFCADGTYCACAEAAGALTTAIEADHENRLAPLLSAFTPPPSENDGYSPDTHGFKLPPLHPNFRIHHPLRTGSDNTTNIPDLLSIPVKHPYSGHEPVTGGPGSCKQCQEDPKSGLFCRSLAAIRASNDTTTETSGSCCSSLNAAGEGCCMNKNRNSTLTLSCAETYKTLAVHKSFDQASDNIDDWLPKLYTSLPRQTGRAPLDVEAASVMNVLKYFDVRFGRS